MSRNVNRRLARLAAKSGRSGRRSERVRDSVRSLEVQLMARIDDRPRVIRLFSLVLFAGLGHAVAGPVAAAISATYATVGVLALQRIRVRRQRAYSGDLALEALTGLAAELRAGVETATVSALVASWSHGGVSPERVSQRAESPIPVIGAKASEAIAVVNRMSVACRVSERLGAPLADLFDRIERDLRSVGRLRMLVSAQVSGSWATVVLLAALPPAGLALGVGFGADPVHELLHTRLGAVCALLAMGMQVLGLLWTSALVSTATRLC